MDALFYIGNEMTNPCEPEISSVKVDITPPLLPCYFTASTFKLSIMSVGTFGLYELYWFYRNWALIKARTGQGISPVWRSAFAPIWAYSCFRHIKNSAKDNKFTESLSIGVLAVIFFILQALWRLPDPLWLVSFLTFVPIIPVNSVAININKKLTPSLEENNKLSASNLTGLAIGVAILLLSLIGLFWS